MRKRFTTAFLATSASVAATVALGLGAAGSASASVASHKATPECLAQTNCVTPDLYSPSGSPELVLQAAGLFKNAPVIVQPNDTTEFLQDWVYIDLGTVGSYYTEDVSNTLGLTGFDNANYGSDELYQLEFSPGGIPSGYCAASVNNRMVLRWCNGSKFQTYIAADSILGAWNTADGTFGLSVVQAANAAHHNTATGSRSVGAQVTFQRPWNNNNQDWDSGDA